MFVISAIYYVIQHSPSSSETRMTLISVHGLSLKLQNSFLLQDINFQLHAGEIVGLIGPNGAGKSSLLKILAKLQSHYSGRYCLNGLDIKNYSPKTLAKLLGYLAQGTTIHWPLSARKIVEMGRLPHMGYLSSLQKNDAMAIQKAIERSEITDFVDRPVTTLSGGEKMRVLLARLFAGEPTVILADEPTAALDPYHQLHVMELLREHAHQGGTVLVVLHDLNHAAQFCDRLLVLDQGKLVADATMPDLLQSKILQDVYRIDLSVFHENKRAFIAPRQRY